MLAMTNHSSAVECVSLLKLVWDSQCVTDGETVHDGFQFFNFDQCTGMS